MSNLKGGEPMKRKCLSVKVSEAEVRKIQSTARDGESMSATLRRMILGGSGEEKTAMREWTDLIAKIDAAVGRGAAMEEKIDLLSANFAIIFSALENRMESIAAAGKDGDHPAKKWMEEVEETLAMLRTISQWMVAGSPSVTAKVRQTPTIEKFLM
jgi:hypothetical protein